MKNILSVKFLARVAAIGILLATSQAWADPQSLDAPSAATPVGSILTIHADIRLDPPSVLVQEGHALYSWASIQKDRPLCQLLQTYKSNLLKKGETLHVSATGSALENVLGVESEALTGIQCWAMGGETQGSIRDMLSAFGSLIQVSIATQ